MDGIQEGPFQNFEAIHFGGKEFYITVVTNNDLHRYIRIRQNLGTPVEERSNGSDLQGIITGNDSGVSIDLSLFSVQGTFPVLGSVGAFPGCERTWSGLYEFPSGDAVGFAPLIGAAIAWPTPISYGQADIYSSSSFSPGASSCDPDLNAPALPAFINGEKVTITKPDP